MIKIIEKKTGCFCSEAASLHDALAIVATAPGDLEIDQVSLLETLKAEARQLVVQHAEEYGNRLTARYPLHEILSWPVKIAEAKGILDGMVTEPPIIGTECRFTGAKPADVAKAVLAKAGAFASASGAISGIRQAAIAKIDEATDEAGIAGALEWAKAAAEQAFALLK